jgi:hypothetical protein
VKFFIGLSLAFFMSTSQASELTSCLDWYVTKGSGSQLNLAARLSKIDNSITFREPIDGPCSQFGDGYVHVSAQNNKVKEFQIIFYSAKLNIINFLSPTERLILNKQYQLANSATYYPVVIPRIGEHFTYSITKTGYGYQELIRYGTAEVRD